MRKIITALTATLFLVSTSFATSASGGKEDKHNDHKKKNDEYSSHNKKDDYDFDERDHGDHHGHHHGHDHGHHKFVWQFFPDRPDDLKCKKVVVYIPEYDHDYHHASYRDDDRNDHKHGGKKHKVVGYLCKVPVSKY